MINILKRWFGIRRSIPSELIERWIKRRCGDTAIAGPFKSARYLVRPAGFMCWPYVLGIYEIELHALLRQLLVERFATLLNVGASDGYYAVGFALSSEVPRVIAYESDPARRRELQEVAALNGVSDRIQVKGTCDLDVLKKDLASAGRSLMIVDIEGSEKTLLDPAQIPEFRHTHILVELHDCFDATISTTLRQRFCATHMIEQIHSRRRQLSDFPIRFPVLFRTLLGKWLMRVTEDRGRLRMSWYYMAPKPGG